jgi:hypothetical protein
VRAPWGSSSGWRSPSGRRVAGRKGHSFLLFLLFSLLFFPAALIVAYVVDDRRVAG